MPQFLITLTSDSDTWDRLDSSAQEELLTAYDAWAADLRERDVYVDGAATGQSRVVTEDGGTADVTGHRLTGLFTVDVPTIAEAAAEAARCPAHRHGETVTVYELT